MTINKRVELPLRQPLYSTYNYQGSAIALTSNNPTVRNWYINMALSLSCNRKFINGYTSPDVNIVNSSLIDCPYIEKINHPMRFIKGYIHNIIHDLLNQGYYAYFNGVDDYYLENKSFYGERHFSHDGLIFGYDDHAKTYCVYAYDKNWIVNKFEISQKSFDKARKSMLEQGIYGSVMGLKPKTDVVEIQPKLIAKKIKEYLDSTFEKYPIEGETRVYGTIVHDYISLYLDKLSDGSIEYEKMDWRIFRLIWEHKKVMYERIVEVEKILNIGNELSYEYEPLVTEANAMRMLYASHHMKRRDAILQVIRKKLMNIKNKETDILKRFIERIEGVAK